MLTDGETYALNRMREVGMGGEMRMIALTMGRDAAKVGEVLQVTVSDKLRKHPFRANGKVID